MTIFVAGRFTERMRCRMVAATLRSAGYVITSRWLYHSTIDWRGEALKDLDDVRRSDALVLVEPLAEGGGGRYIETGYALALRRPVYVWDIAPPIDGSDGRTIYWSHPLVTVYTTLPGLVAALAAPALRLSEDPIG